MLRRSDSSETRCSTRDHALLPDNRRCIDRSIAPEMPIHQHPNPCCIDGLCQGFAVSWKNHLKGNDDFSDSQDIIDGVWTAGCLEQSFLSSSSGDSV